MPKNFPFHLIGCMMCDTMWSRAFELQLLPAASALIGAIVAAVLAEIW